MTLSRSHRMTSGEDQGQTRRRYVATSARVCHLGMARSLRCPDRVSVL